MLEIDNPCCIGPEQEFFMSGQKPKLGQKGAIREIAKELTELRKSPLSPKTYDVVRESYEQARKDDKNRQI